MLCIILVIAENIADINAIDVTQVVALEVSNCLEAILACALITNKQGVAFRIERTLQLFADVLLGDTRLVIH